MLTRKAVVDETRIPKSIKVCKAIDGTDASHFYPYSVRQPMSTELSLRYDFVADFQFKPRQKKSQSFENKVISYSQRMRPDCRIESFYTTGTQKMINYFEADGFCEHWNIVRRNELFLSLLLMSRGTTCSN